MNKLTTRQIEEIRDLKNSGKTQQQIATFIGISQKSVSYWLMEEKERKDLIKKQVNRFRDKPLKERQLIYKHRLPYIKTWRKKKYAEDEVFREKIKTIQKKYKVLKK